MPHYRTYSPPKESLTDSNNCKSFLSRPIVKLGSTYQPILYLESLRIDIENVDSASTSPVINKGSNLLGSPTIAELLNLLLKV